MADLTIDWPLPGTKWSPDAAGVDVWAASLQRSTDELLALADTLSPEERTRSERFRFEQHRNRFIAGRGLLRGILAMHLNRNPRALEFVYGPNEKPGLAPRGEHEPIHFNLAHSGDLVLIAVTRTGEVGIDVERIRPVSEAGNIVERYFSPRESGEYRALPEADKPAAFFNLWTRKEAWLKATGEGIGRSLNEVEVAFRPGEPARLISLPGGVASTREWNLCALTPASGYIGALAARAHAGPINCWCWP